jgi:hypothetical protein
VPALELEMVLQEVLLGCESVHLLIDHIVNLIQEDEEVIVLVVLRLRSLNLLIDFPNIEALSYLKTNLVQDKAQQHHKGRSRNRGQITEIVITFGPQLAL